MPTHYVCNSVSLQLMTNMVLLQNFELMSDKYEAQRFCS